MAVAITKILDGARNAVYHVSITGDELGDLSNVVLIDPVEFDPAMDPRPSMSIECLWYDLAGFNARLEFDYLLADTPVWSMSDGQPAQLDFCCIGGLADRSNPVDGSGKLKISTTGLGVGDVGTIVIKARKS